MHYWPLTEVGALPALLPGSTHHLYRAVCWDLAQPYKLWHDWSQAEAKSGQWCYNSSELVDHSLTKFLMLTVYATTEEQSVTIAMEHWLALAEVACVCVKAAILNSECCVCPLYCCILLSNFTFRELLSNSLMNFVNCWMHWMTLPLPWPCIPLLENQSQRRNLPEQLISALASHWMSMWFVLSSRYLIWTVSCNFDGYLMVWVVS